MPLSPRHLQLPVMMAAAGLVACVSADGPEMTPTPDPVVNFETLWHEFDERYSFFVVKGIDWDALYGVHRPRVTPATTPAELFGIMADLLAPLEDGHVVLRTSLGVYAYTGWYDRFPDNFDASVVRTRYLSSSGSTPSGRITFGRLPGGLGYVRVSSLGGEGWADEIDPVLTAMADAPGLILDVRHNGGGSDQNGEAIAGRFTDRTRVYRRIRWRDGPRHSDFTDAINDDFAPQGGAHFDRPVALLTNRRVFSSAESFVLAMRTLPQVTTVGDTTGGGSANPIELALPNGWSYTVSRWVVFDLSGVTFEGTGIGPEVWVTTTPADESAGRDPILERAVTLLNTGTPSRGF